MKRIKIELSVDSCERAIDELQKYERDIRPKLEEVCKRLAELGRDTAQRIFDEASSNVEEGNGNVVVTCEPISNGWKIVASGEDVYFIEFGTGNSAGAFYGEGLPATSVPIYPGSYSQQNSGQFAKWGYWFHEGNIMSSTTVYMPMYYAGKAIRENAERIAQEVFSR